MSQSLYTQVDKFWKLVTHSSTAETSGEMFKFAGRENRKSIEKKLRDSKLVYDARRLSLQGKRKAYEDMAQVIDKENKEMVQARDYMQKAYEIMKNMDLVDSQEVRLYNNKDKDDVGYVKKNRIFRLKTDENGNVELEPFRRKQLPVEDADMGLEDADESDTDDELSADDLIESLTSD